MTDNPVFKTSAEALDERRKLLLLLKVCAGLAMAAAVGAYFPGQILCWVALLGCLALLWRLDLSRWLDSYAARELKVQLQAVEEQREGFTRFILFEQLEQLRARQGKDEKIQAIELRTLHGAFVIRGYEGMENLFAQLCQRRPERVMVELEEAGIDWQSPKPWVITVLSVGALALVLLELFR